MKTHVPPLHCLFLFALPGLVLPSCLLLTPERIEAPCPVVTTLSLPGAPFDSLITVTGENFLAMCPELHAVKIGGVSIPPENIIEVPDAQTLRFKVPRGCSTGLVSVSLTNAPECSADIDGPIFTYYYTATLVTKFYGNPPPIGCNNNGNDCLNFPIGIDLDHEGSLWVADFNNHFVRKIRANGTLVLTVGHPDSVGCGDDLITNDSLAPFYNPIDVAVIPGEGVYVAENTNTVIRSIGISGVSVKAGHCRDTVKIKDGACREGAILSVPQQLAVDGTNVLFIDNGAVRNIDQDCGVSTIAEPGTSIISALAIAVSRAIPGKGPIFIADQDNNNRIKFIEPDGTVLPVPYSPTLLVDPAALTIDSKGNIFVADKSNHKIYVLYALSTQPSAQLVVLAGSDPGYLDGLPGRKVKFLTPSGLALDEPAGILYVADSGNNVIRKIKIE